MAIIGIIGGSGFYEFPEIQSPTRQAVETLYGKVEVTSGVIFCSDNGQGSTETDSTDATHVYFIPRHGGSHNVLPHLVSYRANIAALEKLGVEKVVALNAVGSISTNFPPDRFIIPDQIIDYTYGREHTFVDTDASLNHHIDFTQPFDETLRHDLLRAVEQSGNDCSFGGVYGCTQGPRLETAAEIRKLANDGCDMVGMTMMPEAALAREMELAYASICLPVNWAAGVTDEVITIDAIMARLNSFNYKLREVLHTFCISQ